MRALLNDWLLQVHSRFRLLPETLFLCANLTDRFLSARLVSPSKLQLVGLACLLIAAKYEETVSPAIENFHVLKTIEWTISPYMSPMHWLRRISKADTPAYNAQTRTLGKYLCEIALVERTLVGVGPSLLAAAGMWVARVALGVVSESGRVGKGEGGEAEVWTPTLAHYSGYTEREILASGAPEAILSADTYLVRREGEYEGERRASCAFLSLSLSLLLAVCTVTRFSSSAYIICPRCARVVLSSFLLPLSFLPALNYTYRAYANSPLPQASVFMRTWALARWDEGTKPDLVKDLAGLKAEIRLKLKHDSARRRGGEEC
ncbi:cyclin-like protein [Mycena leptocephala]|nr:cyclin-like protein [Mycena leptocephala]